jgi:hypothetical protein
MGLSVRRIHRGDCVEVADSQRSDVLLVDEADSMPDSTWHMLLCEGDKRRATTTVLLCLPASIRRFSTVDDVVVVELMRLSQSDTRHYLQERATHAGFPDLFSPTAFDLIVDGSRGVPRSLWFIASLAYFYASSAGASQIDREHVAHALSSQIAHPEKIPAVAVPSAPSVKPVTETPVRNSAAPSVANPQRASANVAVFKRGNSVEPPRPQTSRSVSHEAAVPSMAAAVTRSVGTIIRGLDPIPSPMSEPPRPIAAASDDELPIDDQKVESLESQQPVSIGFVRADAGRGAGRSLSVIVGSAAGVVIALAATAALTIFFQTISPSEKAAVAPRAGNVAVKAPDVDNPRRATPSDDPRALQATNKGSAANKTAGLSNARKSAANQPFIPSKGASTRAAQRIRTATPALVTASGVVPFEDNTVTAAPVQAPAAADAAEAEADIIMSAVAARQQQAENDRMAKEAAAQAQAKAIREADAREATKRSNALAQAAAKALTAAKEREGRVGNFKVQYHLLVIRQ